MQSRSGANPKLSSAGRVHCGESIQHCAQVLPSRNTSLILKLLFLYLKNFQKSVWWNTCADTKTQIRSFGLSILWHETHSYNIHLADRSAIASQALRTLVKASNNHSLEFYLGVHRDQRQQKIEECARECCGPYKLCVSPRNSLPVISVTTKQYRETSQLSVSNTAWVQSLWHALQLRRCEDIPD